MATVSTTLPSDGQTIDASDVNTPINAILSEFNGSIDDNNIKTGANINGAKLANASIPSSKLDATAASGWFDLDDTPDTVTYNGNRSYDLVFNANDLTDTVSEGMRLRTTRTVTAPTQCADLNGSNQYFNDTSVAGTTFTDDFCAGAWVKLESYGSVNSIVSRFNGTSGWDLQIAADGTIRFAGFNASSANFSRVSSFQSIPLNKWVHITAQLDMSAFSVSGTTNSYIMLDGVAVPASVDRAGTNPTALVQAGNLEVGSRNGGTQPFNGKLAQVFYSSAKITQANVQTLMSQGLTPALISTHSIVSAYSLSNDITDLNTTTANNLTAQNSAVATNVDSPFGNYLGGTLDYAIITKTAFSTNTTLTVQVPEGCTIPTSGGVSAVAYSTQSVPYGFVRDEGRWRIQTLLRTALSTTSNATYGAFNSGAYAITVPVGSWTVGHRGGYLNSTTTTVWFNLSKTSLTGLSAVDGYSASPLVLFTKASAAASTTFYTGVYASENLVSQATYTMQTYGATTSGSIEGSNVLTEAYAEFNLL